LKKHETRTRVVALLVLTITAYLPSLSLASGPPPGGAGGSPPGGSGAVAGAGAGGAPGGSGGAPTTPSALFCNNCINYPRPPSHHWGNWFRNAAPPAPTTAHDTYLCYRAEATGDAVVPYVFRNVAHIEDPNTHEPSPIPCYSSNAMGQKPLLRGDRLRVVIDLADDAARATFANLSILNLNVTLTSAPPLQPTILRFNSGGAAPASGLGGSAAPESDDYDAIESCYQNYLDNANYLQGHGSYSADRCQRLEKYVASDSKLKQIQAAADAKQEL
jgi:hypothetical protein